MSGHVKDAFAKPDAHTFASLLTACRRAGDQQLALQVYRNSQDAGCNQSHILYDAAIAACQRPVDLDSAMQIYADMRRYAACQTASSPEIVCHSLAEKFIVS